MNNHTQIKTAQNTHSKTGIERSSIYSNRAEDLSDIYRDDINISIWQRTFTPKLLSAAEHVLKHLTFRISTAVTPQDTFDSVYDSLGANSQAELISKDVAEVVGMFCYLFELEQVGLRLTTLDRAMCPKFHVDRVPCRLVATYSGIATEWLDHKNVDRTKLGAGSQGKTDEESGLYDELSDIHQLETGDIALLKGESWEGNVGGGLVHRSPSLADDNKRLLLTLDFI